MNVMRPRRKNPATAVAKSAISHATARTLVPVLRGVGLAGAPVAVDTLAEAVKSATSAARLGILPATATREEEAADMEEDMDRAKEDTGAEVATPAEVVVRVRPVTPVVAMVICLATAPKVKSVTTVSSFWQPRQGKR